MSDVLLCLRVLVLNFISHSFSHIYNLHKYPECVHLKIFEKLEQIFIRWKQLTPLSYCFFSPSIIVCLIIVLNFWFSSFRRTSVYKSSSRWCRRNAMFPAQLDNKSSKWVNKCIITHKYDHKCHSFYACDPMWALTQNSIVISQQIFWFWHDAITTTDGKTHEVTTHVAQT